MQFVFSFQKGLKCEWTKEQFSMTVTIDGQMFEGSGASKKTG